MSDVKAVFHFNLSKAGLNQELIQTGIRGTVSRKVEALFSELSPEDRVLVIECGRDVGSYIEVKLQDIELNSSVYQSQVDDEKAWIKATAIELDAMPTVPQALALARHLWESGKAVREQAKLKVAGAKAAAAEQRRRNLAAYRELHKRLYRPDTGLITTGNLESLRKWTWADSTGHVIDTDFRPSNQEADALELHGNVRHELRRRHTSVVEDAIKELEKAAAEAEKDRWIKAHGSTHLREAWLADYPSSREYLIERAAMEFPGFTLDFDDNGSDKTRSFPSEAALKAEKHLESFGVKCRVVWVTEWPSSKVDEDDRWGVEEDPREAIVVRGWHGKDLYIEPEDVALTRVYGEEVYKK